MENCWQEIQGEMTNGEKVSVRFAGSLPLVKTEIEAWGMIRCLKKKGEKIVVKTQTEEKKVSPDEIRFLSGDVKKVTA